MAISILKAAVDNIAAVTEGYYTQNGRLDAGEYVGGIQVLSYDLSSTTTFDNFLERNFAVRADFVKDRYGYVKYLVIRDQQYTGIKNYGNRVIELASGNLLTSGTDNDIEGVRQQRISACWYYDYSCQINVNSQASIYRSAYTTFHGDYSITESEVQSYVGKYSALYPAPIPAPIPVPSPTPVPDPYVPVPPVPGNGGGNPDDD